VPPVCGACCCAGDPDFSRATRGPAPIGKALSMARARRFFPKIISLREPVVQPFFATDPGAPHFNSTIGRNGPAAPFFFFCYGRNETMAGPTHIEREQSSLQRRSPRAGKSNEFCRRSTCSSVEVCWRRRAFAVYGRPPGRVDPPAPPCERVRKTRLLRELTCCRISGRGLLTWGRGPGRTLLPCSSYFDGPPSRPAGALSAH